MCLQKIVPFPLVRRRGLVRRQAAWFLEQRHDAAEANLRRELHRQREALLRKGVAPPEAEAEAQALETAIRTEAWLIGATSESGA